MPAVLRAVSGGSLGLGLQGWAWRLQQLGLLALSCPVSLEFLLPSQIGGELPITKVDPRDWATLGRERRHQTLDRRDRRGGERTQQVLGGGEEVGGNVLGLAL